MSERTPGGPPRVSVSAIGDLEQLRRLLDRQFRTAEQFAELDATLQPIRDQLARIASATTPLQELMAELQERTKPARDLIAATQAEIDKALALRFEPLPISVIVDPAILTLTGQDVTPVTAIRPGSVIVDPAMPEPPTASDQPTQTVIRRIAPVLALYFILDAWVKDIQDSELRDLVVRELIVPILVAVAIYAQKRATERDE
jgi:hypothetical protein